VIELRTAAGPVLRATDDPTDPLLHEFHRGYDQAFVIEAEKEPLSGFVDALHLNRNALGQRLAARYGRFREFVVVARESDDPGAPIVGGANGTCLSLDGPAGAQTTLALNYLFVMPAYRRRGLSRLLLDGSADLAARLLGVPQRPLVFLEQHDPLRVSAEDSARDSASAGIDQRDRLRVWARCGAWIVDFAYAQPPLSPGAEVADNLLLSVCAAPAATIDACTVAGHLERFFAIACLKGRPLSNEPTAAKQVAQLNADCAAGRRLRLLDPTPWLDDDSPPATRHAHLREALTQ